ncbi:MAG: hemerythrin family protein [Hyphomicrobiales bacterium]|nr:hemerythrin family protein [Hyphomicrobiales bacterium]
MEYARAREHAIDNCKDVDRQHDLQFDLLHAFQAAVHSGADRKQLDELLDRLVDFSKVHFCSEQVLMRLYTYERYEAHVNEHEETLGRIEALREAAWTGAKALTQESLDDLTGWIISHIRHADRDFGDYLINLGRTGSS